MDLLPCILISFRGSQRPTGCILPTDEHDTYFLACASRRVVKQHACPCVSRSEPHPKNLVLLMPCCCCLCSYPDAMQFASGSSKASCLYVGSVATAQYSSLTCTMHTIIKQQQQLKAADKQTPGGQRRSHFQRTPAFIESVIAAALSLLSEDPETGSSADDGGSRGVLQQRSDAVISITPPRGGFTDVGRHTGSCPKATSWPVLQSVFQVG